jgi:polysaccharide pyruvyl transferase WcaK-like protein
MADPLKVVLLHAYSPRNSGDGLLVELARALVRQAFGDDVEICVIASDAEAFNDDSVLQWESPIPTGAGNLGRQLGMLATALIGPTSDIRRTIADADLLVAVGGGYLRGGYPAAAVKSWGAHFGQLRLAARQGRRALYLPQSIGPFMPVYRGAVARHLERIAAVYVRDDRSVAEFPSVAKMQRRPDMAILELAEQAVTPRDLDRNAKPLIVARELRKPRTYYRLLDDIRDSGNYEWAIQSIGGGNNDQPLTKRLAGYEAQSLKDALAGSAGGRVVVSTRLHGSLSSLIAGHPSIHLSYERKGWGAFEDLGIGDFVLSARDATLDQIEDLRQRILDDPEAYWAPIRRSLSNASQARADIVSMLRSIARVDAGVS